ncbi:MAG: ABC transporter ATP-binding protein [Bdellovibrio sp.]
MTPLCTLKNLTLTYPHKNLFLDVSFTLNKGDKIGVLGLNGHGKSSLFKVLAGTVEPNITTPAFQYDKASQFSLVLIPQELPIKGDETVEDYFLNFYPNFEKLHEELKTANPDRQAQIYEELDQLGEATIHQKYTSYLKSFGIQNFDAKVFSLSGGEQRKIALSLGLSAPHEIVLWDEPTNHLDLNTIEIFEEELKNSNKTYMIISHDRTMLNNVVDRIIHIQHGKIRSFQGTYNAYLEFLKEENRDRELRIEKLSNLQRRETAWISRGAKARRTKSKKRIEDYQKLNESITELKSLAHKSVSMDLKHSGRKTKQLIEAIDLGLAFKDRVLFKHLNFKVMQGAKIALMGQNGVGKSSLLKIMMGELQPSQGQLRRSEDLKIGYFSQKRESLDPEMTPWQLIGEGTDFIYTNTGEKRHVASYLENFLFKSEELKRPIKTFSGGEKNRLQLAYFMKDAMDVWIFDEPTNDLDLETIGILEDELKEFKGTLIIVGHDRSFIENTTTTCWLIHQHGLEIFEGGFSQCEYFLEALELEEKLRTLKPAQKREEKKDNLSNKDKMRLDKVQQEISEQETMIAQIDDLISRMASNARETETVDKISALEAKRNLCEEKLMILMEEWEELEAKR